MTNCGESTPSAPWVECSECDFSIPVPPRMDEPEKASARDILCSLAATHRDSDCPGFIIVKGVDDD